jgi:hypothetical protein
MIRFFRLTAFALALVVPLLVNGAAGAASGPTPGPAFEEVAAARDGTQTQARSQTRQRRPTAQGHQRRHRDQANRAPRRTRAAQG